MKFKKMKRKSILLVILFFAVGLFTAEAQQRRGNRPDPATMAKNQSEQWQEAFGLSDDQTKNVHDLLLETSQKRREKMMAARDSGDRTAMRTALEETQKEMEEKLKAIFSETQWKAYEKWKKDNPPQQRRRGGR